VGARNWDPAGKPVAGQPQRRRPDRRSGRVPGSDATPVPPRNPGSKTACRNRFPTLPADMVGCPFGRRHGRCRTRKVDLRGVLFFRTSWGRPDLRKRVRSRATTLATIRICSCLRPRLESPTRKRCGLGRCCLRRSPGHPGRRDIHPGCRRPCEQHLRPTRVRCRRLVGSVTRLPFRLG